jgi:hypothetical protein
MASNSDFIRVISAGPAPAKLSSSDRNICSGVNDPSRSGSGGPGEPGCSASSQCPGPTPSR